MNRGDSYGPPDIDWDLYLTASLTGHCKASIARDNGKLVGYSVYSIGTNPRYKTILEAWSDGIFLEKEYRGKGLSFLKSSHVRLKEFGVKEIKYLTNDEAFGKLLERLEGSSTYKLWSFK